MALTLAGGCKAAPAVEADPVLAVHCVNPSRIGVDETLSLRGRVATAPGGDLPVASQVAGRIVSVTVHEGQRLAKGAIVASVDDLASRDILRQANATVAQAHANEVNSDATLSRVQALVQRGIAPRQELEDAQAKASSAHAAASAAVAAADLARTTLGRVVVRTSFEGVVTRVIRGPGALVDGTAATPIVQLAASNAPEFVADATESQLSSISPGQTASGELATEHVTFKAKVVARSSALDPATGLGVVRLAPDTPLGSVPMGAYGRVAVVVGHRDAVRVIPVAALRGAVSDGAEVVVCDAGHARLATVQTGYRDAAFVEITGGIADTDRVAVDHVLGLVNGTPIAEVK